MARDGSDLFGVCELSALSATLSPPGGAIRLPDPPAWPAGPALCGSMSFFFHPKTPSLYYNALTLLALGFFWTGDGTAGKALALPCGFLAPRT